MFQFIKTKINNFFYSNRKILVSNDQYTLYIDLYPSDIKSSLHRSHKIFMDFDDMEIYESRILTLIRNNMIENNVDNLQKITNVIKDNHELFNLKSYRHVIINFSSKDRIILCNEKTDGMIYDKETVLIADIENTESSKSNILKEFERSLSPYLFLSLVATGIIYFGYKLVNKYPFELFRK